MADRFPGEIHIGGTLRVADHNPDDIDAFLAECSQQPTEWGEPSQCEEVTLSTISQVIDKDTGFIIFRDDQACYGEFEELEELCRELGLSYDRTSDARYEYESSYCTLCHGPTARSRQSVSPGRRAVRPSIPARPWRRQLGWVGDVRQTGPASTKLAEAVEFLAIGPTHPPSTSADLASVNPATTTPAVQRR